jgi:ribonuclease J
MLNNVDIARRLGYLQIPDDMIVDVRDIGDLPDSKVTLLTTGSQGEPYAALTRMARGDHYHINIKEGDSVVLSASAIPGNEKYVGQTINQLFDRGANVTYQDVSGVHVSGHASQEELKLMMNLTKPKYFIPTHGEDRHIHRHANLAEEIGIPRENIYIADLGDVIQFKEEEIKKVGSIKAGDVLVDGLGIGDVGNIVLRDRRLLSEDGIIIVVLTINSNGQIISGPDIITRGFVYIRESEELIAKATVKIEEALQECEQNNVTEWSVLKPTVKNTLKNYVNRKIKRNPMIMPIIMEV